MASRQICLFVGVSVTVCGLPSFYLFQQFVKSDVAAASRHQAFEVDPLDFFVDDSADWCERIGSSPEPREVLYNRIPKAGSSTMQHLLRINNHGRSRGNRDGDTSFRIGSEFWGNTLIERQSSDGRLRAEFDRIAEDRKKPELAVVIDGHFYPMFKHGAATYFNIMRNPRSRLTSWFYYSLHDSHEAKALNRSSEELVKTYGSDKLDEKCYDSLVCQKFIKRKYKSQLQYLCEGDVCGSEGEKAQIFSSTLLEVGGFLEEFDKSLEMLECVYPTVFNGVREAYGDLRGAVERKGSRNAGISSERLDSLIDEACGREKEVYDKLMAQFLKRYERMRVSREVCCRGG